MSLGQKRKCLEDPLIKLIELDQFKPKIKDVFDLIKMIHKWRNDTKSIKHYDLIKLILDEFRYSSVIKNKKDLGNEIDLKI